MAAGVPVVFSAGNSGPDYSSVDNVAPWVLTVGASTIDRSFSTKLVLANKNVFHVRFFCFTL